jgi:apolipoprotein N-acyltransferase
MPLWGVALGGVATAFAFPLAVLPGVAPLAFWPLAWVGVAPFLARLLACRRWREASLAAVVFALAWFLVAGVWVFRVFDELGGVFLLLPLGWFLTFALAAHATHRTHLRNPRWPGPLLTWPVLWIAVEYIRSEASPLRLDWISPDLDPLRFSWFVLGHSRLSSPLLAQTAAVWGGFGLSLAPFLVNLLLARAWVNWRSAIRISLRPIAAVLLLILVEVGYGFVTLRSSDPNADGGILVGVVQSEQNALRVKQQLSENLLAENPDTKLIVWPEDGFTEKAGDLEDLKAFAHQRGVTLVVGCQAPLSNRRSANRAYWIDPNGEVGFYDKHERVPIVEMHPPGKTYPTFAFSPATPPVRGGILICFDMDFANHIRNLVREGAEFVVMPSMDEGGWGSTEHAQHALLARLRAIENRRPIAQASSSGVSQIVDSHGRVLASLPFGPAKPSDEATYLEGAIAARIQPCNDFSVYTRGGFWLPPLVALIGGGILVGSLLVRPRSAPRSMS